jgi:hypothetical protein
MKSARTTIPVKLGFFGSPKPQRKQSYVDEISKLVLKVCNSAEGHDNLRARSVIHEAGDVAIALITGIFEDPYKMKNVRSYLFVEFEFNNDYTDWLVTVDYSTVKSPVHEHSPNYSKAIEEERAELFERYGFKDEVDTRVWMVSFRGKHAEMTSDELKKFREEFGANADVIVQEKKHD